MREIRRGCLRRISQSGKNSRAHFACRPRLLWCPWLNRPDPVWSHHLVVLVLDDVTVPDELARCVELRPHPCHLARIGDNRILETRFRGLGGCRRGPWVDLDLMGVLVDQDNLSVDDLEDDLVDVDG